MALIMDKAPELQFLDGWKRDDAANANPDVAAYDGASAAVEGAEFETLESPSDEPSRLRLYWLKEVNWEQNRFTVVPESLGLSPIIGPLRLFGTAALLESGSERGGDLRLCVAAPAFDFLTSHLKYEFGYREMHAPVTVSLSARTFLSLVSQLEIAHPCRGTVGVPPAALYLTARMLLHSKSFRDQDALTPTDSSAVRLTHRTRFLLTILSTTREVLSLGGVVARAMKNLSDKVLTPEAKHLQAAKEAYRAKLPATYDDDLLRDAFDFVSESSTMGPAARMSHGLISLRTAIDDHIRRMSTFAEDRRKMTIKVASAKVVQNVLGNVVSSWDKVEKWILNELSTRDKRSVDPAATGGWRRSVISLATSAWMDERKTMATPTDATEARMFSVYVHCLDGIVQAMAATTLQARFRGMRGRTAVATAVSWAACPRAAAITLQARARGNRARMWSKFAVQRSIMWRMAEVNGIAPELNLLRFPDGDHYSSMKEFKTCLLDMYNQCEKVMLPDDCSWAIVGAPEGMKTSESYSNLQQISPETTGTRGAGTMSSRPPPATDAKGPCRALSHRVSCNCMCDHMFFDLHVHVHTHVVIRIRMLGSECTC